MEPFIAEIQIFGGNFAPRGWALCDGQLLAISSNSALFSILGTTYGGDGRTTFGLPDLRGRVAIGQGNGPGLSPVSLGERTGVESVTLNATQLPNHQHTTVQQGSTDDFSEDSAAGNVLGNGAEIYSGDTANTVNMHAPTSSNAGGNQSHDNMQPFITINYIIALVGLYPSRS